MIGLFPNSANNIIVLAGLVAIGLVLAIVLTAVAGGIVLGFLFLVKFS